MRKLILGSLFIFGLVAAVYFTLAERNKDHEISKKITQAVELMNDEKYEEAYALLMSLSKSSEPRIQIWLGQIYIFAPPPLRNDKEALRIYENLVMPEAHCREKLKHPSSSWAYAAAKKFKALGQEADAKRWYKYAADLEYDPIKCPIN